MSKHAAHISNRYLGNRAVQAGNAQDSQPQQSPQGVRSTLLWSSENTNKNTHIGMCGPKG